MSGMKGTHLTDNHDHWDGPFNTDPNRKILYVCGSPTKAKERWYEMGRPENVRMGYPGMAICGEGFDEIILDEIHRDSRNICLYRGKIDEWVRSLRCRLYPDGRMRVIRESKMGIKMVAE